jgi:prolyl-tRNA synthetase
MKYTKLIGKTKKHAPADETSNNAKLLIRAGFIEKEMAGVYTFLPLGWRVISKIIDIIREEMEAIGGQELHLGSLQNPETWKKTNRWDDEVIDVWFKTQLKSGSEIGLATTHEEPLTKVMTQHIHSYKDLPLYAFQFQTKFRNETRAKSGVLRTREFLMKDLYSFDLDKKAHEEFYRKAKQAYINIFERAGVGDSTFFTFASGGAFSKYSHEFQTVCPVGEDTIYLDREKKLAINQEVYTDDVIAELGLVKEELEEVAAIEVGNIFNLGTRFSTALGLQYSGANDKLQPVYMGSYGLGPARLMATVVELNYDDKGMVWPETIAPFRVHLVGLNLENTEIAERAEEVYTTLTENNIEILFDDRTSTSAGQKFNDADLIGCPYRVVVSAKTAGKVELKKRTEKESKLMELEDLITTLEN